MTPEAERELASLIKAASRSQLEQIVAALLDAVIHSERGERAALKWMRKAVEEHDAIVLRLQATTPGTWEHVYYDGESLDDLAAFVRKALAYRPEQLRIELVTTGLPDENGICPSDAVTTAITGNGPRAEANAAFIAHAHEDVETLLDENERLRTALEQIIAAGKDYANYDVFRGFDHMLAIASAALEA